MRQGGGLLPAWIENPPADSETHYFGIGEGFSLRRAKEAALNDIAGKLGTEISSKIGSDVRQYGEQVTTRAHQVISARIRKTRLIHPRVLKSAEYQGKLYLLLSVSIEAMAKDAASRLKQIDQHLKQQWKSLSARSRLQQFIRTQKLSSEIDEASGLAITLQVLDRHFVSEAYLERYNVYRKKSDALLSAMHFRIRTTKTLKPLAQHLVALLSRAEIQSSMGLSRSQSLRPQALIEVTGGVNIDTAFSNTFAGLSVVLEVKDVRGNTIARRKYQAKGQSLTDAASATRDAIEKLMKQWEGQSVLNVIGLNL